jgi:hypothetical protein
LRRDFPAAHAEQIDMRALTVSPRFRAAVMAGRRPGHDEFVASTPRRDAPGADCFVRKR